MDPATVSRLYELEQAHEFLDSLEILRTEEDMLLSLKGRIERLIQQISESDLAYS